MTTSQPLHVSLVFAVCSVKNQPSYFADRLYKAMKVSLHSALDELGLDQLFYILQHVIWLLDVSRDT